MNINKLDCGGISEGMAFRTYSDMCRALGVVPGRGNSLAAQKRLFSRYFEFERCGGQRCVISKVFDYPLPLRDGRSGNKGKTGKKGKYVLYIEPLLLGLLRERMRNNDGDISVSRECGVSFTKREVFEHIGFVNSKFFYKQSALREISDVVYFNTPMDVHNEKVVKNALLKEGKLVIDIDDIRFFEKMSRMIYDKWRSAVKAVNRRGVIMCKDGYVILSNENKAHVSDGLDLAVITEAENDALDDIKAQTIQQAFVRGDYALFFTKLTVNLRNKLKAPGAVIYKGIELTAVGDEQESIDVPVEDIRRRVNEMMVDDFRKKIHKCADIDVENHKNKLSEWEKKVIERPDFCKIQERLLEIFVKI